jgi:hypothetical protein
MKTKLILALFSLSLIAACASATPATPTPKVVSGAGDITAVVEEYRNLLGADNGGEPVSPGTGRREINWDGLPDELAAPNDYAPDLFNSTTAPRARGIMLNTEAGGVLQVSADAENAAGALPRFGHLNPTYAEAFQTFSAERLFSPVGSNIVDATFFVPGTQTPAAVRGFGAVYTDVDTDHTAFEYFDKDGKSLGQFAVPLSNNGLSFLGVAFDEPIVARVRIEYGTVALGPDDSAANDVAVMDNFIYGEPVALKP